MERLLFKLFENEDGGQIPDFYKGRSFAGIQANIGEKYTVPPKSYTEDTLLSAMEALGSKETIVDAECKGLGNPATRALYYLCLFVRKLDFKCPWTRKKLTGKLPLASKL